MTRSKILLIVQTSHRLLVTEWLTATKLDGLCLSELTARLSISIHRVRFTRNTHDSRHRWYADSATSVERSWSGRLNLSGIQFTKTLLIMIERIAHNWPFWLLRHLAKTENINTVRRALLLGKPTRPDRRRTFFRSHCVLILVIVDRFHRQPLSHVHTACVVFAWTTRSCPLSLTPQWRSHLEKKLKPF